jgi:hypothetical protein
MKDRYLRRQSAGPNKLFVLQAALLAETDRADIPAAVTFDALLKFVHPSGQPLLLTIRLNVLGTVGVVYAHLLFADSRGFGFQIGTIPVLSEI